MIRFVRQSFGCSSEVLRKKYRFPEADPKVIRRRPEESTLETGQNASKPVIAFINHQQLVDSSKDD
ncbi:hypothetical protein [Chryseobacterium lineare]